MVLLGRIELPTSALPRMRSTTELQQHTIPIAPDSKAVRGRGALLAGGLGFVNLALSRRYRLPDLSWLRFGGRNAGMTAKPPQPSREDRLAAKLRENLRRRKAQARELGELEQSEPTLSPIPGLPKGNPSS